MRLRVQPAAEQGRRQVVAPQFRGRRRRTVRTGRATGQRHRSPEGRFVRAARAIPGVCAVSAPGGILRFPRRRGVCHRTVRLVRFLIARCIPMRGRCSRPQRVPVPGRGVHRARIGPVRLPRAVGVSGRCTGDRWARDAVVGRAPTVSAGRVIHPEGLPRAQHAMGTPVAGSVLFLCVTAALSLVMLEFDRDRGEHALPQVFRYDPKLDLRRWPGRAGCTRDTAGKRRDAAVIYHAATPRRPAHERGTCLDSGTYIAWLIQPKSHIVARKLPKVRTPYWG